MTGIDIEIPTQVTFSLLSETGKDIYCAQVTIYATPDEALREIGSKVYRIIADYHVAGSMRVPDDGWERLRVIRAEQSLEIERVDLERENRIKPGDFAIDPALGATVVPRKF